MPRRLLAKGLELLKYHRLHYWVGDSEDAKVHWLAMACQLSQSYWMVFQAQPTYWSPMLRQHNLALQDPYSPIWIVLHECLEISKEVHYQADTCREKWLMVKLNKHVKYRNLDQLLVVDEACLDQS